MTKQFAQHKIKKWILTIRGGLTLNSDIGQEEPHISEGTRFTNKLNRLENVIKNYMLHAEKLRARPL